METLETNNPSIIELLNHVRDWHISRISKLEEILNTSHEKTPISIQSGNSEPIALEGESKYGFLLGLETARLLFAKPPFTLTTSANELGGEE